MDLRDTPAEATFRAELRAWLAATVPTLAPPPAADDWPARRAYDCAWQRTLFDAGYAGLDWPADGGGRGATPAEQLVFVEELERVHAPYVGCNFVGLLHAGPTIAAEGTPEQRARWLPAILRGEAVWCQGFSEPDAGSDLASLRTRAVRDGDDYVVSGSKIWTSFAEVADLCELLVRTGPEGSRHRGITWLVMAMDSPGIDVRPLRTITGSTEFAELFLDEVRIPVSHRVGAEDGGWQVAMTTFAFERGTAFVGELLQSMELLRALRDRARDLAVSAGDGDGTAHAAGGHLTDDLAIRIGRLGAELDALWALVRRNVSEGGARGVPGPGGSIFKLAFSELRQRLAELAMDLAGPAGLVRQPAGDLGGRPAGTPTARPGGDGAGGPKSAQRTAGPAGGPAELRAAESWPAAEVAVDTWLNSFSRTIAAGTSQVQRTIIAERALGLPKG